MKKFVITSISILLLISAIIISCSKEKSEIKTIQDPVVVEFLESNTFLRSKNYIESFGTISYNAIKSDVIGFDKEQISVIGIPIIKDGEKVGVVEVVDLKTNEFLPNGDSYAMNFVNLKKFDSKTLTGDIEMIDLNYDDFIHSKIKVENNFIKSWETVGLSEELANKYASIRNLNKPMSLKGKVLCDANDNGNVSFSECYHCLNDAIDANGFSQFLCDVPVAGWASCWGSVSAACVYISARY